MSFFSLLISLHIELLLEVVLPLLCRLSAALLQVAYVIFQLRPELLVPILVFPVGSDSGWKVEFFLMYLSDASLDSLRLIPVSWASRFVAGYCISC